MFSSATPAAEVPSFLRAHLAFRLLAATDGHAKNFSLFLLPGGRYRMTPRCDVITAWPIVGAGANRIAWQEAKLAMAVRSKNTHYQLARIQTRHWEGLAQRSGADGTWQAMQALVARVPAAIAAVQAQITKEHPAGFPQRMTEAIFDGLRLQVRAWESG